MISPKFCILFAFLAIAAAQDFVAMKEYAVRIEKPTTTEATTMKPTVVYTRPISTTTKKPITFAPTKTESEALTYGSDERRPFPKVESRRPDVITADYVLAHSTFTCNGLKDGDYADTDFHCRFFHRCSFFYKTDNKLYIQETVLECGEGTSFNQTVRSCDYTGKTNCHPSVVQQIISEQLIAPTPAPGFVEERRFPVTAFRCSPPEKKQGYYYADIEVGCSVFHRCVYHEKEGLLYATQFSFWCAEGTVFNQETISCMAEEEVDCKNSYAKVDFQEVFHPEF